MTILFCVLFAFVSTLLNPAPLHADEAQPVLQIGFVSPLSGARASLGADARDGAELAAKKLNRRGRPPRVQLLFEDSQAQAALGVGAFQKLASSGVPVVVTQNSSVSLPIMPIANRLNVVQIAITTTSDRYSTPDDYCFRVNGPTTGEARAITQFLLDRRSQIPGHIALLSMEDEYIQALRKAILAGLAAQDGVTAFDKTFLPSENDFRSLITQMKGKGTVHAAFLGYATHAGAFAKQQAALKLGAATIIVPFPVNTAEFFTAAGENAEGFYGTNLAMTAVDEAVVEYAQTYGRKMSGSAANAYDAVWVAALAGEKCLPTPTGACLKRELGAIRDFHGVSGQTGFDGLYGDMQENFVLLKVRNGEFVQTGE